MTKLKSLLIALLLIPTVCFVADVPTTTFTPPELKGFAFNMTVRDWVVKCWGEKSIVNGKVDENTPFQPNEIKTLGTLLFLHPSARVSSTLADKPCEFVFVFDGDGDVMERKLFAFQITFSASDYSDISGALTEKFGKPDSTKDFIPAMRWDFGNGRYRLTITKHNSNDITKGMLSYGIVEKMEKAGKADTKEKSKDL